jgi:hypothetical protein
MVVLRTIRANCLISGNRVASAVRIEQPDDLAYGHKPDQPRNTQ